LSKKINTVKDINLSFLFRQLYGEHGCFEPYHEISLKDYKKHILKMIDTIKSSIAQTITAVDNHHLKQLLIQIENCKIEIKKAKSFELLFSIIITFQAKLIISFIGELPDNFGKRKVTNQPANWQLNTYRQIGYTQSREQKFELLRKLFKEGQLSDIYKNYSEAVVEYQRDHLKGEDLYNWFKRSYPQKYIEIFDSDELRH